MRGTTSSLRTASWTSFNKQQPNHTSKNYNRKIPFTHYITLGLWRDASHDQIKQRYYELSKQHHPDVSQDPSSFETFSKVTEAYAVLGKKKTRRKYDQHEQLYSALLTGLQNESPENLASSSTRPVDPTFWDPVQLGSSTFYRPPPGYWTAMNKLTRDREKLNARKTPPPPETTIPSHRNANGKDIINWQHRLAVVFAIALAFTLVEQAQEWILRCSRAFLVQLRENNENESSALQGRIYPTSQDDVGHNHDMVRADSVGDTVGESQARPKMRNFMDWPN